MKKLMLATTGLVALVSAANAQVLYSTSFEAPTFVSGALYNGVTGQDGWTSTSTVPAISTAFARTGTQSLNHGTRTQTATGAALGRWSWKDITAGWNSAVANGKTILNSSVWVLIPATGAAQNQEVGIQLYANGGADVVGAITYNPFLNRISGQGQTTGGTATLSSSLRGSWFQLGLSADIVSNLVSVQLNGSTLGSFAFTTENFSDMDIFTFSPASTVSTGGSVYWDDYSVEAVPEPATMAALGLGVAAMLRRRKK